MRKLTLSHLVKYHPQIILLVGLPESGATSLRSHSIYTEKVLDTPLYEVYTHENTLLIQCYDALLKKDSLQKQESYWQSLTKALYKKPITCLLTINITQLINRKQPLLHKQLQFLLNHLNNLQLTIKSDIHYHLVLTQLDNLVGFSEYFSYCQSYKKTAHFGMELHQPWHHPSLLDTFDQKFHGFMNDINTSLLKNIEQSSTRTQRGVIKDFPIQLESLRKPIASLLQDIISHLHEGYFHGLYFTSCQQDPLALDRLHKVFQKRFSINHQLYKENIPNHSVYFVQGLWETIYNQNKPIIVPSKKFPRTVILSSLSVFLIGYGVYLYHGYHSHEQWLAHSKKTLIEVNYLLSSKQESHSLFVALETLQNLLQKKDNTKKLQPHMTEKVFHQLQNTYIKGLHQTLFIVLQQQLQQYMTHPKENDTATIYETLKAYLMLSPSEHYDPHYLSYTLKQVFQKQQSDKLHNHFNFFAKLDKDLQHSPPKLSLDHNLIAKTQHYLLQLPTEKLVLAKLSSNSYLLKGKESFITLNKRIIPAYYQKKYLPIFYYEIIPLIAKETLEGDWVLAQPQLTTYAINNQWQTLTDKIRSDYLKAYVTFWQDNIATYESIDFRNLEDAHKQLHALINGPHSLAYQWQVIKDNIVLNDHTTSTVVSDDFITLAHFLEDESHLHHIQQHLKAVDASLLALTEAKDLNYRAYDLAKRRYTQTLPEDPWSSLDQSRALLPEPFNAWLSAISQQSWHTVMVHAGDYVKQQWQSKVHDPFSDIVANKYPYAPEATLESTQEDITLFFGPSGVLAQFYKDFLDPFVEANKQEQWVWKTLNGSSLQEDRFMLEQLQQSAQLLTLLYSTDKQTLAFTEQITPLALEPGIKNMTLTINKQHGKIYPESHRPFPIQWIPEHHDALVMLSLTNNEGEHFHVETHGPWAWCHLLDKAQWSPRKTVNHWLLTFNIGELHSEWDYSNDKEAPVALTLLRNFAP